MDEKPLAPHEALSLFQAKPTEKPQKVSEDFGAIYNFVKSNLFFKNSRTQTEKLKSEVKNKINLVIKEKHFSNIDYLKDLLAVIELDSLPRHYLRLINKIKVSEFNQLPNEITLRYITTILSKAAQVDAGTETLIISEELI
jgi:hypothetical protein